MTFMERAIAGGLTCSELRDVMDDAIDEWHANGGLGTTLHEHLGMTWDEYAAWVKRDEKLEAIVEARRAKR